MKSFADIAIGEMTVVIAKGVAEGDVVIAPPRKRDKVNPSEIQKAVVGRGRDLKDLSRQVNTSHQ